MAVHLSVVSVLAHGWLVAPLSATLRDGLYVPFG